MQRGEPKYRKAWSQICEISRKEFDRVYQRLGVQLEEKVFLGFSFTHTVHGEFCRLTEKFFILHTIIY